MNKNIWVVSVVVRKMDLEAGRLADQHKLCVRVYDDCTRDAAVGRATLDVLNQYVSWGVTMLVAQEVVIPENAVTQLEARLAVAVDALEALSKLGNGDQPGNSAGNVMAQEALTKIMRMNVRI